MSVAILTTWAPTRVIFKMTVVVCQAMLGKEMLKLAKGLGCGQPSPLVWEDVLKILRVISTQLSRHKNRGNTWVGTIAIVDDTKPENAFC